MRCGGRCGAGVWSALPGRLYRPLIRCRAQRNGGSTNGSPLTRTELSLHAGRFVDAHTGLTRGTAATAPVAASLRPCPWPASGRRRGSCRGRPGPPRRAATAAPGARSSDACFTALTPPSSLTSRFLRVSPEAGDVVEHARGHALVAQLAVVGDGEAVGLVADALEQVERLGLARDADRVGLARARRPPRTAWPARPPGSPRRRPELLEHPHGHAELALAAVDEEQLRRVGELAGALAHRLARRSAR